MTVRSIPVTRDQVVERAVTQAALECFYRLGRGGLDAGSKRPVQLDPATGRLECDCSGFAAWALGESRYQPGHGWYVRGWGGWVNTDAMVADGRDASGGVYDLARESEPGNLLVFPSLKGVRSYGHVGVVVEVRDGKPWRIAHCSSGNLIGRAIAVTSADVFTRRSAVEVVHQKLRAPARAPAVASCPAACPCTCHPTSPPAA